MFRSMFARFLSVFLVVILVCVGILFSFIYVNVRNNQIATRTDALKVQARDMAYLASQLRSDKTNFFNGKSTTERYMEWKANRIYEEYDAYILVVERSGIVHTYYSASLLEDESLNQFPSSEEIATYMERAAAGEEISLSTNSSSGPLFTVIVPWIQENAWTGKNAVMGLVMVQTAAQNIRDAYDGLIWPVIIGAVIVFIFAAVCVFFLTRQMTKPLTTMANAAGEMAKGNFVVRAPVEGSSEVRELADAFNQMTTQLSAVEHSRRDFVANVSHELRSPITNIQGFAQGMLDGTIPQEEHKKYLQVVTDETHRLNRLINNLLNLSRIENEDTALALSNFDINELSRRVLISRITQIEEKKQDVEVEFENDSCFVYADADQIEQVIINLLDNAIKYTPEHGILRISTREEESTVFLRIKDNGIGILPEDAKHIFERFYKADKSHTVGKGTGLGLAICKSIMEKHGQTIQLISGENGCEFEITLKKGKASEDKCENQSNGKDQLDP